MVIKSRFLSLYFFFILYYYITHIILYCINNLSILYIFLFSVFVSFERFWDGPQRVCPHRRWQSWLDVSSRFVRFWYFAYIYSMYTLYICIYDMKRPLLQVGSFFFSTKLCYVLMCCAVCFSPDAISWCCFPSPCLFGISNVGTFAVDFRACPHGPVTHLGTWLQLTI